MELFELCHVCDVLKYNSEKYDEYGEKIEVKLCEEIIIEEDIIQNVSVKQIIPYDKMFDANDSLFNKKNKLNCGEE